MTELDRTTTDVEVERPWPLATAALLGAALTAAGSVAPWFRVERELETHTSVRTISGIETDGAFSLVFAAAALVALLIALFHDDTEGVAWVAVWLLGLCAVIGLFDWIIFDSAESIANASDTAEIRRVAWGLPLTALAGLAGTATAWMLAREINRY